VEADADFGSLNVDFQLQWIRLAGREELPGDFDIVIDRIPQIGRAADDALIRPGRFAYLDHLKARDGDHPDEHGDTVGSRARVWMRLYRGGLQRITVDD
jgi:hypothetical protein